MKALLDTSVLVATFYEEHDHHEPSFGVFTRFAKRDVCCASHSLAEVYATLTSMPGRDRVSGTDAVLFLKSIQARLSLVYLNSEEYLAVTESAAACGLSSGGIYDALIGHCALKAKAQTLYTWNLKHFQRLAPAIARRVKSPA